MQQDYYNLVFETSFIMSDCSLKLASFNVGLSPKNDTRAFDVVVLGSGNAGLCAALSAREAGAKNVLLVERGPLAARGGNSYFAGGLFRFAYDDGACMPDIVEISAESLARSDFGRYDGDDFYGDLCRVTNYRCDPELAGRLVNDSLDGMQWLKAQGVRFELQFGRHSFKVGDRQRFAGGAIVAAIGGGAGLVDALFNAVQRAGITVWYSARGKSLLTERGAVRGVRIEGEGGIEDVTCGGVVLATGGFEANPQWRAKYLGAGWDLALVRGTQYNTGDGIQMALDAGAQPYGHWSGAHAVSWEANAPPFGDRAVGDLFSRHSYTLGIMVNRLGKRFVDEGADMRVYTYAKYGVEVLKQPEQIAYQIFDQKTEPMLREDYRSSHVTRFEANSIAELAGVIEVDSRELTATVEGYNRAARDGAFDPSVKDGLRTDGITPPKSNWAQRLDSPPFVAFPVSCGITYTFGGVRISAEANVMRADDEPIPGLFGCGEIIGGLFYHNYPGGTGLMTGAVYGRVAGRNAAIAATAN